MERRNHPHADRAVGRTSSPHKRSEEAGKGVAIGRSPHHDRESLELVPDPVVALLSELGECTGARHA
eukprot:456262-Pyramimonas_sp.AAC.1